MCLSIGILIAVICFQIKAHERSGTLEGFVRENKLLFLFMVMCLEEKYASLQLLKCYKKARLQNKGKLVHFTSSVPTFNLDSCFYNFTVMKIIHSISCEYHIVYSRQQLLIHPYVHHFLLPAFTVFLVFILPCFLFITRKLRRLRGLLYRVNNCHLYIYVIPSKTFKLFVTICYILQ